MLKARWVVVGNEGSNRVALLNDALTAAGHSPAVLVPWTDLIAGRPTLAETVRSGDIVRLESPGRDFAVERAMLALGAEEAESEPYAFLPEDVARALEFDKGRLWYPRQWYRGFARVLGRVQTQLATGDGYRLLNDPQEVALCFDKPACQERLSAASVPTARLLGILDAAHGYEDLLKRMAEADVRRVFVKIAHGSSAAGIVAYRIDREGGRHQAITTVDHDGERLYNSRRVQTLTEPRKIADLIDSLARHRVYAEEWLPKASLDGAAFDVRALVIAGRLRHVVGRRSRTPMTNLHLLNDRTDAETVRARVGERAWAALGETAERAAGVVAPNSLHVGLDILWTPGFQRLAVLEANAFGDLLGGALSEGQSPYEAEVAAVRDAG